MPRKTSTSAKTVKKERQSRKAQAKTGAAEAKAARKDADQFQQMDGAENRYFKKA